MSRTSLQILSSAPMSFVQIVAIGSAFVLNGLDGFDVLAVTFAAPGMATEWGASPAALGVVISAGLAGMGVGSLLISPLADRYGRRPTILISLVLMTVGMLLAAAAGSLSLVGIWRFLTGLGIGGMLSTLNAVTAEFANERRRDLAVSLVASGFPLGALLGGLVAAELVQISDWRAIFMFGGVMTALAVPIVWRSIPESIHYLAESGKPDALAKINRILERMGHPLSHESPQVVSFRRSSGFRALFGADVRGPATIMTLSYFLHVMAFYFFAGWLPQLLTGMGFDQSSAIRTAVIFNIGGVIGGLLFGYISGPVGLKRLVTCVLVLSALFMFTFSYLPKDLMVIRAGVFILGMAIFACVSGLYALFARGFPTNVRVTGTGVAIGIGRVGAVLGPLLGGLLLSIGLNPGQVTSSIAPLSLVAAVLLIWLKMPPLSEER
ncbi:MFS transporter [Bradyrhizobium sp. KBS0727]|uniref:MFS transporter n=1 Tax=unclassified Bradyrhizobium TaxID=2631580 RepID=UPI00110EB92D|nr:MULTISPECIES: MFS transporter [unclassified Bradyrhizobium]QDW40543.1 MFS transporter [Bradyrhizobium sp. KBS0725]QDW47148.1 MFS transporter [Bradyrhizobium sp. KBS0727]